MPIRSNVFLGAVLVLLVAATYVVLAGREPAPTTTGEPTPTRCLSQAHECVTATFLGYSHHDDGTTTLSYRITNNCTETVETIAIETGHWTRVAPTEGGSYTGNLGDYTTAWIGPVGDILTQGIRFTNASPDYHSGVSDDFTITVRNFVAESPNTIRVVTKGSGINNYSFRWMLLDPTCENGVAPLPSPTATATFTPTATLDPAIPTATWEYYPTPESCLRQDHECVTATFLGYSHHDDGTTTLSYRITNNCAETVETIAIETGHWTRIAPTEGGSYTGTLGDYATQWIGPVGDILTQGIRFNNQSDAYHSGVSDDFTITVRDFVAESPNTIRVVTKGSGLNNYSFRWMLLDPSCENGVAPTPRPMPTSTPTVTPTPTNTPTDTATPLPTATQPQSPLPTPTLDPSQVLRVLPQLDVTLGPNEEGRIYTGFVPVRMDGDHLIGRGSTSAGESHLVTVNLTTGQVQRLSEVGINGGGSAAEPVVIYGDLAVQPSFVVYPDNTSLRITNLRTGEYKVVALEIYRSTLMSFQDGLAAWHSYLGKAPAPPGLYGYLLAAPDVFLIEANNPPNRYPTAPIVCNAEWIAYRIGPYLEEPSEYEIWVYHQPTAEKIYLDTIYGKGVSEFGLRCDGNHLIWLKRAPDAAPGVIGYQLWHFDLTTRERRLLADDVRGASTEMSIYDDILWNWNTVYDLRTGAVIAAQRPTTGNNYYTGYQINDAYVRVLDTQPVHLAIVQLERLTP